MSRSTQRLFRELLGVEPPHAWAPPAMLTLTLATYSTAFGIVSIGWWAWSPAPEMWHSLVAPAAGGVSVLGWMTIVNAGWACAVLADTAARLFARKNTRLARIRAAVLAILGLGIVAGVQIAIETIRVLGAQDP